MGWYERSFGRDYLKVYQHRDESSAQYEVDQLIKWLNLPRGAHVLDLCCGNGRHAVAMAEYGFQMIGLDLSHDLLAVAKQRKIEQGIGTVVWIQGDSRNVPLKDQTLDGLVNLFTSFGYFDRDEENEQVINEMSRLLKPGGRFVMDFLNAIRLRSTLVPQSERFIEGWTIRERRWIDATHVHKEIRIFDPKTPEAGERMYQERVRLFEKEQLISMCQKQGIRIEQIYGDFNGQPFDPNTSARLILVGEREKG